MFVSPSFAVDICWNKYSAMSFISDCIGKCSSNPCFNGGTCYEGYSSYTCDCSYTPFRGWMCGRGKTFFHSLTISLSLDIQIAFWRSFFLSTPLTSYLCVSPPLIPLMVRFQWCYSFGECKAPLHCHHSQVHSGLE